MQKFCSQDDLPNNNIKLQTENDSLRRWVGDLLSGMYINCVYCGYRYGPKGEVPESMADVLKAHIEICGNHPMSLLKRENEQLRRQLDELRKRDQ